MGSEFLGDGVEIMRKGLTFTIRCCFRSVHNHPLLVGFLCFLILLQRSSPFVFSLLVSASPVLVCTAVLLGLLLSYGEPNIPEIEVEERKTKFETNGGCFGQGFGEKGEGGLDDAAVPLIEERSVEIESGSGEIREEGENRELGDLKMKTERIDEKFDGEVVESDGEGSEAESFDSEKVNVASLDSPPRSPWTQIEEEEDEWAEEVEEEKQDKEEDSGSDGAESSSPDASMADIMPMLDELHPLLDEETSHIQPIRGSHSGSDVALKRSSDSSTNSWESDDVSEENHDNLDDDQDDDDDNEEGEDDALGEKEELTKSAITWTEEDQKNLMNLGSSEIERNQRLENLILKRRSRKDMNMIHERNLIDLESTDYPLGLAPISTRRRNPFDDLHHDSYDDNVGLPLIPGSAPSVMLERRNPFDIPYDPSEEKPDLMGDGFKEEFTTSKPRGAVFRRHESFSVGPSVFAPNGKGVEMRPYFVPESMISEGLSYSSSRPQQSSEFSESKVSYVTYVPENETTGLVEDLDDRKLLDKDHQHVIEASPQPREIDEYPSGDPQMISHQEDDEEEDINVGHGSQSSEDEESLEVGRAEQEIQLEDVADHSQQERVNGSVEDQATEYHPNNEGDEHVYRRDSSSSSLSEVSERVFTEIESEGLSVLEERRNVGILSQTSTESINLSVSGPFAIDIPQRAPVYDLSPRQNENSILPETSTTHPVDANDDAYQRADEKLISTSVEGNAYLFHDTGEIREPNFQHLDDVQASSVLVELDSSEYAQITQNSNKPEVQELVRDIQSNINSQFSPKSISNPPGATETTESQFNSQTAVEQEEDIKDIDEDILAELDSVGDFSVQQWPTGFEKRFDSVKENEIEADVMRSEKWREDIDVHEEGAECVSEPQISEASGSEHIEVSRGFGHMDDLVSPDSKTSEKIEMQSDEKNNSFPVEVISEASVENEITYTMPKLEAGKIEDTDVSLKEFTAKDMGSHGYEVNLSGSPENIDSFNYKSELAENEVMYQGQVDIETACGMNELKASNVKDIGVAFKDITAKETVVEENLVEHSKNESSSVTGSTLETIEEDTSLVSTQSLPDSVDRAMHVNGSEETQGILSGLDVAGKSIPSEEATLPSNDDRVLELLKSNSDDESVEVDADEVSPSVVESRVQEISVAAEKPGNEVEVPKDSDSITYVKGKDSKGSSSSSSSSSDSSSSDSDKE